LWVLGSSTYPPSLVHICLGTGQEQAPRLCIPGPPIGIDQRRGVATRVDRKRQDQDILTESASKLILQLGQDLVLQWADRAAVQIKEADQYGLVLEQIGIETYLAPFVGNYFQICKIFPPCCIAVL